MNKLIILVFVLNFLCKHCHCDQDFSDLEDKLREVVKFPSDDPCNCVRSNECDQEDILKACIDPNLVCCRRLFESTTARPPPRIPTKFTTQPPNPRKPIKKPSQKPLPSIQGPPKTSTEIPTRIPPSQPTTRVPSRTTTQTPVTNPPTLTRPQDTPKESSPTNADCTCRPRKECLDTNIKKTRQQNQEDCRNPNDVCCSDPVQKVTTPLPQRPKTSHRPTQSQTLGTTPRPQLPSPTQASLSIGENCTCTPFYKCYDEETSSNLTNIVHDRTNICGNPNDVCCYNLVKNTTKPTIVNLVKSSSEDCAGSCIAIQECPYLFKKLKDAQGRNSDAVKELRRSVCSNKNGNIRVCCPASGSLPCQFPFIYEGVTYSECTTIDDPDGKLWCSTQTDDRNNHLKDQYKLCTPDDTTEAAEN